MALPNDKMEMMASNLEPAKESKPLPNIVVSVAPGAIFTTFFTPIQAAGFINHQFTINGELCSSSQMFIRCNQCLESGSDCYLWIDLLRYSNNTPGNTSGISNPGPFENIDENIQCNPLHAICGCCLEKNNFKCTFIRQHGYPKALCNTLWVPIPDLPLDNPGESESTNDMKRATRRMTIHLARSTVARTARAMGIRSRVKIDDIASGIPVPFGYLEDQYQPPGYPQEGVGQEGIIPASNEFAGIQEQTGMFNDTYSLLESNYGPISMNEAQCFGLIGADNMMEKGKGIMPAEEESFGYSHNMGYQTQVQMDEAADFSKAMAESRRDARRTGGESAYPAQGGFGLEEEEDSYNPSPLAGQGYITGHPLQNYHHSLTSPHFATPQVESAYHGFGLPPKSLNTSTPTQTKRSFSSTQQPSSPDTERPTTKSRIRKQGTLSNLPNPVPGEELKDYGSMQVRKLTPKMRREYILGEATLNQHYCNANSPAVSCGRCQRNGLVCKVMVSDPSGKFKDTAASRKNSLWKACAECIGTGKCEDCDFWAEHVVRRKTKGEEGEEGEKGEKGEMGDEGDVE